MKKLSLFLLANAIAVNLAFSQGTAINSTGAAADSSAILDLSSTTKGTLITRMTTGERNAIASPAQSLLIFNTTSNCLEIYISPVWQSIYCGCTPPAAPAEGTHIPAATQIEWVWNTVSGATGYKWNTANDYNSATDNGTNVTCTQTSLTCGTAYTLYVWAYNSCSNSSYTTLTQTTSACTGPTCGTQVWAASNLNAGTQISSSSNQTTNQKWCYNDDPAMCATYGAVYQWSNVMLGAASVNCDPCGPTTGHGGVQGMCPYGYHIPSDLEWSRYEYCIENTIAPTGSTPLSTFQNNTSWRGSSTYGVGPGSKMKVTSGDSPSWDGTNTSGFTALPAGEIFSGNSLYQGGETYFWASTQVSGSYAWSRGLYTSYAQVVRNSNGDKNWGFMVRCLQD